jgi:hypothetical protein
VNYKETVIEGTSYTDAFVNFEIAYPGETVCEIKEAALYEFLYWRQSKDNSLR